MRRHHAILAVLVLAATVWAYFVAHPLSGRAPKLSRSVQVWDVPPQSVTALTLREGKDRVALQPQWKDADAPPYIWVQTETTMQRQAPPATPGRKQGPPPAPTVESAAFKGNATAHQILVALASLTAQRDVGPYQGLDAKQFGLPNEDDTLELTRGDKPALKMQLGRLTYGETGRYVRDLADGHVYLLPVRELRRLKAARAAMMDRDLLGYSPEQADRIELHAADRSRTLFRLAKAGQWGEKPDAAQGDSNMAALVATLQRVKVMRYLGTGEAAPTGKPDLEVRLARADGKNGQDWLRLYAGKGVEATAVSSYTQRPVEVPRQIVQQVLDKSRALLHGT
ncbi:MAG TPA: DUF4340 domain-containing protein [bacterium]|nr:DUF4340 domain-containing protein [bacterium]